MGSPSMKVLRSGTRLTSSFQPFTVTFVVAFAVVGDGFDTRGDAAGRGSALWRAAESRRGAGWLPAQLEVKTRPAAKSPNRFRFIG